MAHTRETYPLQCVAVCSRLLQCVAVHRREIHPLRAKHVHTPCAALLLHVLHSSGSHRIPNRRCGSLFFFLWFLAMSVRQKNTELWQVLWRWKKNRASNLCVSNDICALSVCVLVYMYLWMYFLFLFMRSVWSKVYHDSMTCVTCTTVSCVWHAPSTCAWHAFFAIYLFSHYKKWYNTPTIILVI